MRQDLRERILAIALAVLILMAFVYWFEGSSVTRVSGVVAVGVGVYWGMNCSQPVASIDWGVLSAGSAKNTIVYVRNEAQQLISLNMSTENWSPSTASNYIQLKWDYSKQVMNPSSVLKITLILSVSSSLPKISGVSFNLVIAGVSVASSNVIFADGFESGNFSNWTSTSLSTGESAVVTGSAAYQGSYGASFRSNGTGGSEYAYCYESIAGMSELFARGYFYVSKSGITANDNRFYFLIFRAGGNSVAFAGWRMVGGVVEWELLIRDGTGWVDVFNNSNILQNRWYSVELHWYENSTSGYAQMYVNGQLTCSLQRRNTASFGDADTVRVGLPELENCGPTTVYCDSIVVSKTYVGPIISNATVYLQSVEGNGASSNYGLITFNGATRSLPFSGNYVSGTYSAQYSPNPAYVFVNWTTTGNVAVSNASSNPTNVIVNGNGNLTAVYKVNTTVLFKDGFESGNFNAWTGTYVTTGETATVVSTVHQSGSHSALFTTHGGSTVARAYCYKNLSNQSQLYTLAYVYFNSSVSLPNGDNLWLIQFRDSGGSAIASFGLSKDSTSVKWATMYGGQTKVYATSGPTAHVWYAVEAYFNKTASGKALVIYVNGTQVAALSINTSGANSVAQVRVGIAYNAVGYKNYVYVDTAIIDNKYITPPS